MKSKALLLVVVLSQMTCHQVLFTAPPGSTMNCSANPTTIPAVNGVSVISCLVVEEIGTPVADGTVAQFFTTLGRIPEQGRTNDGVVRVNFESTGRSGEAEIRIFSGGGSSGGGGGGSSTTTTSLSAERSSASGLSASGNQVTAALSGIQAEATVRVTIGNATASTVFLTGPQRFNENRPAELIATVVDSNGNFVPGVPVFFRVEAGNVTPTPTPTATATATATVTTTVTPVAPVSAPGTETESLDSQGQPVFTDTNGQARDVLRTRWPINGASRPVTVFAQTANGRSGRWVLFVN
jgi:hypothetical protein